MSLTHTIEYWALLCFARLLCILPRKWSFAIGSAIGAFGWAIGMRQKLVLENIAVARPEADEKELKRLGKQAAKNFGRTITEFIRYGIKDRDLISDLVEIKGIEELKTALQGGKGAIVLTGHFGAWAIYFAAMSMAGVPLSLLVGKQHNKKVDDFILKIPGDRVEFISKGRTAIKKILAKLTAGRAVVMVADQHAGKSGVVVPFLGKNASTLPLPGSFAVKYQAPVFIMTGQRKPDGTHTVTIEPIEISASEDSEDPKIEVLKAYNHKLGRVVASCPEQYFWYHRRWREESENSQ
ncbi:lysophospholipid acyltransferase family protein [Pelagicoccus albus]|uniref:Lysophospholipid acyltransferase family protein n=1 Tax=Pelagicoccus albus TaxID=415222 RepID=A0A7X1B3T1_9BACT|nr:lysophospholipid acyltransferase family protein [Pelagicoccus albus]MBC2604899.1 lysophospholipid acyltransferase family protein [Pelagicoccus albus]